jgi:L-fuconolactonase
VIPASIGAIDTHQHYWRYSAADYAWIDDRMAGLKRDRLPADVWPEMQKAGFAEAIAVQARQTPEETTALLAFADRAPWVVGVVGWTDLRADDVEAALAGLSHPKLVGMRHIVQDEPDDRFLLDEAFCRGIACLEDFGLTYDILVYPRHLRVVAEFVSRFPTQRFVLDHVAKPEIRNGTIDQWARDLEEVAAHPNVMAKISGLVTEARWNDWSAADISPYLDVVVELFGCGRLMVGSDWPVCTLSGSYEDTMRITADYFASRSEEDRAAIFAGNARRFWRLPAAVRERPEATR